MAQVAKAKNPIEKSNVVKAFARALIFPQDDDNKKEYSFVPAVVDEEFSRKTGWPGFEAFVKGFCYKDALPDTSSKVLGDATLTLKTSGVLRSASDKGVFPFSGNDGQVGKYVARQKGCSGVYLGRLPDPDNVDDVARMTEALRSVPEVGSSRPQRVLREHRGQGY
jgi:hypothetical protein